MIGWSGIGVGTESSSSSIFPPSWPIATRTLLLDILATSHAAGCRRHRQAPHEAGRSVRRPTVVPRRSQRQDLERISIAARILDVRAKSSLHPRLSVDPPDSSRRTSPPPTSITRREGPSRRAVPVVTSARVESAKLNDYRSVVGQGSLNDRNVEGQKQKGADERQKTYTARRSAGHWHGRSPSRFTTDKDSKKSREKTNAFLYN
jgi:hypothetical protein